MAFTRKRQELYFKISDAVAVFHAIMALIISGLGEIIPIFSFVSSSHGGIKFVYRYIDAPVYYAIDSFYHVGYGGLDLLIYLVLIILLSSFLYWVICYLFLRLFLALF